MFFAVRPPPSFFQFPLTHPVLSRPPRHPQKDLTEILTLHPSYFTPSLPAYLKLLLHQKVEGTCSGRLGYIIAVIEIKDENMGRGKVVEGQAEFAIKYKAIVYRPFRGEVVDGVVASVNKVGFL